VVLFNHSNQELSKEISMEAFLKVLLGLIAYFGPIGLTGFFIFTMIKKQGWKLAQIVAGLIFGLMLASGNPALPNAIYDSVHNVINSIAK
jgi:hypothetical protein